MYTAGSSGISTIKRNVGFDLKDSDHLLKLSLNNYNHNNNFIDIAQT